MHRSTARPWLLALLIAVAVTGCRLNDLLNPGPPPPEEKCFTTVTFTWWNDRGDTTVVHREGVRVACPDSTETP
jgi:hypothetical protein